jgi:hypothetical protein
MQKGVRAPHTAPATCSSLHNSGLELCPRHGENWKQWLYINTIFKDSNFSSLLFGWEFSSDKKSSCHGKMFIRMLIGK